MQAFLPTEENVKFFEDTGYWVSQVLIEEDRLVRYRQAAERVWNNEWITGTPPRPRHYEPGGDPLALRKTDNAWWADPDIAELGRDKKVGAVAAKLLRTSTVRLWHDQLLHKPGAGNAPAKATVGWHQDWHYWWGAADRPDLITAWIAFDDVDESMGALQMIPGSHKWGLLEGSDFFGDNPDEQLKTLAGGREAHPVTIELKAGQVSFHHALTLHGSGQNTTERPRRSLAVHLMSGDVLSVRRTDTWVHFNADLLEQDGGKIGDPFVGKWWPQVYP